MPRFYCPPPLPLTETAELPPAAAHHASRVLRLRTGDAVQIFDGLGHSLDGRIQHIDGKHVWLHELRARPIETPPPLEIVLAQAMSSSDKMDWVVQKATELGAAIIQPVQTERSIAKLSAERAEKRGEHWRGVALSACEQCGRNRLPEIAAPLELSHWLTQTAQEAGSKFILLPDQAQPLAQHAAPSVRVTLLIGPEGGFSPDEAEAARRAGFAPVLFGPRVLRTETAAVVGITACQLLWGDLNHSAA